MNRRIQSAIFLFSLAVSVCTPAFGLHSYVVPPRRTHRLRRAHFRRLRWNPVFRPSRESLLLQNQEIDRMDLPRIQDDAELEQLKASEDLVPIVAGTSLRFDPRLDPERRYCRPWTREFLDDSHLAGLTVDIQRRGLSREQIKWMQTYMLPLKEQGLIEPEEERHQWVFHVMVSGRYTEWRESKMLAGDQPMPEASEAAELPLQ